MLSLTAFFYTTRLLLLALREGVNRLKNFLGDMSPKLGPLPPSTPLRDKKTFFKINISLEPEQKKMVLIKKFFLACIFYYFRERGVDPPLLIGDNFLRPPLFEMAELKAYENLLDTP